MLILHGGFFADHLLLWGETSAPQNPRSDCVGRGRPKTAGPPPFPYDAGQDTLLKVIKEAGLAPSDTNCHCRTAIARLPSRKNKPQVSSPLISESPGSSATTAISPWQVTALNLPPPAEIEFLSICVGQELLAPGIIIGKDLAFWTITLRFAASLAARQRFLPGLAEIQGTYYARWEPLLSGTDGHTVAKLAGRMPSVCRALTLNDPSLPVRPASEVLEDFLGRLVDQLVRFSIPNAPEPVKMRRGGPARKVSEFDSLHDQWLTALKAPDGLMAGDPGDLARLHQHIQQWRHPVSVTAAAPFHLCFRLEEPDETSLPEPGQEQWFLRYLLQAADDPSLLIPVRGGLESPQAHRGAAAPGRVSRSKSICWCHWARVLAFPRNLRPACKRPCRMATLWIPMALLPFSPKRPWCWNRQASRSCCPPGGAAGEPKCACRRGGR